MPDTADTAFLTVKDFNALTRNEKIEAIKDVYNRGSSIKTLSDRIFPAERLLETLPSMTDDELKNAYYQCCRKFPEFKEFSGKETLRKYACEDEAYDHFGKQQYWSIEEGILLLNDIDPLKIQIEKSKNKMSIFLSYLPESNIKTKIENMRDTAERYIHSKKISHVNVPGAFLAWAQRMNYLIPDKLKAACDRYNVSIRDWQSICDNLTEKYDKLNQLCEEQKQHNVVQQQYITKLENNLNAQESRVQELEDQLTEEMQPESEYYSEELDIARITHRYGTNKRWSTRFKSYATEHLRDNYPHLKDEAIKRITTLINPDKQKSGGRTKAE